MANKFRKGDCVLIITGKDKGKSGIIQEVFPKKHTVIVEGLNIRKKTIKKSDKSDGSIQDVAYPIHQSNISHYDGKKKITFKVSYKSKDGKTIRISKVTGKEF